MYVHTYIDKGQFTQLPNLFIYKTLHCLVQVVTTTLTTIKFLGITKLNTTNADSS